MRQSTLELLRDHEKLVCSIANNMAERLDYSDVDELVSFARDALVKKAPKWDPTRGKFSTFITWVLRNAIIDYVGRNRRLVPSSYSISDDGEETSWLENVADERVSDSLPSRLRDMVDGLSESAKEVIHVCLTVDLGDVFGRRPPIEKVRKVLLEQGWDRRETHKVFGEIAKLVKAW